MDSFKEFKKCQLYVKVTVLKSFVFLWQWSKSGHSKDKIYIRGFLVIFLKKIT